MGNQHQFMLPTGRMVLFILVALFTLHSPCPAVANCCHCPTNHVTVNCHWAPNVFNPASLECDAFMGCLMTHRALHTVACNLTHAMCLDVTASVAVNSPKIVNWRVDYWRADQVKLKRKWTWEYS